MMVKESLCNLGGTMSSEQLDVREHTFSHLDDESEIGKIGLYKTGI